MFFSCIILYAAPPARPALLGHTSTFSWLYRFGPTCWWHALYRCRSEYCPPVNTGPPAPGIFLWWILPPRTLFTRWIMPLSEWILPPPPPPPPVNTAPPGIFLWWILPPRTLFASEYCPPAVNNAPHSNVCGLKRISCSELPAFSLEWWRIWMLFLNWFLSRGLH